MPKNLIELIKASGGAGANGQSFKTNVTGAGDTIKMTDYLISSLSWSQIPNIPSEFTVYPSPTVFSTIASVTRGTAASNIQRITQDAFTVTLVPVLWNDNMPGSSVAISAFSTSGNGASFNLSFTLNGKVSGLNTPGIQINYDNGQTQPPASGVLWSGNYVATIQASGQLGYSDCYLNVVYDPDSANFNPTINNFNGGSNGWPLRLEDRVYTTSDYEFRWWDNATDANNNNAATVYSTTASGESWWSYDVTNNYRLQVWMRARNVTDNGSWSSVYTAGISETRL